MIGTTISHYKILEKLGEGGMGVVYKAEDVTLDRPVALKLLPQRIVVNDDDRARFVNEARAAAKLTHPNIATVYEFGEADGNVFLAMEFIEGETVRRRLQQGMLSIPKTLRIACEVASGLGAAHQRGIIHRDIKSENVMLTPQGTAKIMDFGLAQIQGQSRLWHTEGTAGTVGYMSPEQARGETLDERTDIWSLGVVLYEMLTAKLPFPGNYEAAILYLVIHEQPQPIKSIRDDVPPKLQEVVERCLKKDPDQRYQNTQELVADLNTLEKGLERGAQESLEQPAEPRRFETERRPVTIMFATILPANRGNDEPDLEALTTGLDECFDGLASIIQKYEGMKDRILGDRLMAVFGAPVAHENDPERAVRCAYEMMSHMKRINALGVSQVASTLQLKIGIHSGVVVAGNVGTEKGAGYSVVGDVINITLYKRSESRENFSPLSLR